MQKNEAQNERLAILSEECGETVQIIGKSHRHGIDSYDPLDPKKITNRAKLEKEIGDILAAVALLRYNNDISLENVEKAMMEKMRKFKAGEAYLHHQVFRDDWPKTL